ncbi:unnamed protein product [Dibothriocephalus latus]|uniref:Laminin G domain-containing protein n=1 Tax=Dibothriocephalus latus TaxID=60516 RepID=A0A3P6NQT5_DIBLA|nr:unnamed protein product [Dibothriocephalus latus]
MVIFAESIIFNPDYQPHHQLENQPGYDGCLATVSVSQTSPEHELDYVYDPVNPLRFVKTLLNVEAGCHLRGDVWEEDTDATCRPVATTVAFSESERGCAVLEFNPLRNTTKDAIAFGIQTKHREPKRSVLRLTYNMGSGIQVLQDSSIDLADGNFHVIRVVRTMSTAKLQIDSEDVLERHNPNANGTDFNEVHQLFIGCDPTTLKSRNSEAFPSWTKDSAQNRYFVGHLTGLTLNGISIGDILIGESVPGLYVKMSQALVIDPSFTPNLRQSSYLPANDMEAIQPIVSRSPSTRANPLVIAKPTCIEPEDYSKLANCKPSNPHGIVQPRWNLPPLEAKDNGRWNKEQYAIVLLIFLSQLI